MSSRGDGRWYGGDARALWRELCATRSASVLAAVLVALPLAVLSATDVLVRTAHVSDGQLLVRELGHADALVTDLGAHPITQRPDGRGFHSEPAPVPTEAGTSGAAGTRDVRDPGPILALLPRGARATGDATARLSVRLGSVTLPIIARELDYRTPAAAGLIVRRAGRAPSGAGEVAISSALREQTSANLGDTLSVPETGAKLRIVGVVDDPNELSSVFALTMPDVLLPAGAAERPLVHQSWLVTGAGPLNWATVRRLNTHGLLVVSRDVLRDPPPAADVPYCHDEPCSSADAVQAAEDAAGFRLPGTRISLAIALPVLLVLVGAGFGAALAGCARRVRWAESWAMANGATPRGRVSLLAAVVIGLAGAAVGLPLGVGLAEGLRPVLRPLLVRDLGPLNTHPLGLLVIAGFGVLTALAPAYRRWRERERVPDGPERHRVPVVRGGPLLREDEGHE